MLQKLFKLKENNTTVKTEVMAGICALLAIVGLFITAILYVKDVKSSILL